MVDIIEGSEVPAGKVISILNTVNTDGVPVTKKTIKTPCGTVTEVNIYTPNNAKVTERAARMNIVRAEQEGSQSSGK